MSISTASGAFLLAATMKSSGGSFDLFLTITGIAVFFGATLLLVLGRTSKALAPA
jgi:predicted peroxiredoxin